MSEEMIDRVRRIYDATNRRDLDALMEAAEPMDSEVEWVPPPEMPEQGVYRGREAIKKRIAALWENPGSAEVEEFIEAGQRAVVGVSFTGSGGRSGAPIEGRLYQVITTRGDGVTFIRIENYLDRAQALKAAGLRE
jgi:ketosteroid isomerase-like protein